MMYPSVGDFVVKPDSPGEYVIERRLKSDRDGWKWERISAQTERSSTLSDAMALAKAAGTKAWTYELDNSYAEL
jgi:hypothetical protein